MNSRVPSDGVEINNLVQIIRFSLKFEKFYLHKNSAHVFGKIFSKSSFEFILKSSFESSMISEKVKNKLINKINNFC